MAIETGAGPESILETLRFARTSTKVYEMTILHLRDDVAFRAPTAASAQERSVRIARQGSHRLSGENTTTHEPWTISTISSTAALERLPARFKNTSEPVVSFIVVPIVPNRPQDTDINHRYVGISG